MNYCLTAIFLAKFSKSIQISWFLGTGNTRMNLYGLHLHLKIYKAPMHTGGYQDSPNELYFQNKDQWGSFGNILSSWDL